MESSVTEKSTVAACVSEPSASRGSGIVTPPTDSASRSNSDELRCDIYT